MVADDPSVELEVDVETVPAGVPADAATTDTPVTALFEVCPVP